MTSILDALRALTAPPKRSLADLRRNAQPGDTVLWRGERYTVADVRVSLYSGKDLLLYSGNTKAEWVGVVEVFQG